MQFIKDVHNLACVWCTSSFHRNHVLTRLTDAFQTSKFVLSIPAVSMNIIWVFLCNVYDFEQDVHVKCLFYDMCLNKPGTCTTLDNLKQDFSNYCIFYFVYASTSNWKRGNIIFLPLVLTTEGATDTYQLRPLSGTSWCIYMNAPCSEFCLHCIFIWE